MCQTDLVLRDAQLADLLCIVGQKQWLDGTTHIPALDAGFQVLILIPSRYVFDSSSSSDLFINISVKVV